eukprot:CAMPEP_0176500692 /NCGR_PEP_ID=MMETSP0200_2-20121128/13719_1 /TAXON_ID=947934 /ORGANISM="Chaetoceros sp., Strain GSL56" /LENGTH=921 /DNA_ID=CAMNT_0017899441 /DNA_START=309 /DNA_END=3071 /DNA_ORIENTATION=-
MSTIHHRAINTSSSYDDNNKSLIDSCSTSSSDVDSENSNEIHSMSSRSSSDHDSGNRHSSSLDVPHYDENHKNPGGTTPTTHTTNTNTMDESSQQRMMEIQKQKDQEGLSLLSMIFPDTSREELEEIHQNRIQSSCSMKAVPCSPSVENTELFQQQDKPKRHSIKVNLPQDFLRIPRHQALKLPNKYGIMEWNIVANLEEKVVMAHLQSDPQMMRNTLDQGGILRTAVFSRNDVDCSLGMQLREWKGLVYVNCLLCPSGNRIVNEESYHVAVQSGLEWREFGPAFVAGVKPGDWILGVNGMPFLRWGDGGSSCIRLQQHGGEDGSGRHAMKSSKNVLMKAARMIRATGDPIILHLVSSCGGGGGVDDCSPLEDAPIGSGGIGQVPKILAFETGDDVVLEINGYDDNDTLTTKSELSGRDCWYHSIDGGRMETIINHDHNAIHPLTDEFMKKGLIKSKREQVHISRLMYQFTCRATVWKKNSYLLSDPFRSPLSYLHHDEVISEFDFIRQAICVHIVNTFVEKDHLAYTIYVLDIESKQEWYAPIRFYSDFQDLRVATSRLNSEVDKLPFPNASWFGGGDELSLSQHMKDTRRKELESFMRGLCNMVYTSKIDASLYEIALFVQTFLGCDVQLFQPIETLENKKVIPALDAKARIREAVQLYTYRLFLMPTFKTLVTRFVDDVRRRALLIEEKKTVNPNSSDLEKKRIILELVTIKHVFMNILDLIQKGCIDDFKSIALSIIDQTAVTLDLDTFLDSTVRDAVREQIEIEAYVPCRSIISSMLVHGWRYEDKTISYKVLRLREKSQSFFKIHGDNQSPSGWGSVIQILSNGVGKNTLPCNKLKAIVNAGKEISRLSMEEHPFMGKQSTLGADDFLPIFMYCVVNAELDRPCALCALLKNLCDDIQQIGEVGYYLSSFEATIM